MSLLIVAINPFLQPLLQLFFARQIKLVLLGVDVRILREGDLDKAVFFFLQRTMPMVWFSAFVLTKRSK